MPPAYFLLNLLKIILVCSLSFYPVKEAALQPLLPKNFKARVIAIKDGDTIEVLYNNSTIVIRLEHIDCPEVKKHQPFGQAAKRFTSDKCFGQTVTIQHNNKFDRYRRLIAIIINDKNENVNKELVKAGLAWHFIKYSTDTSYGTLEAMARKNKTGLWADENPVPPWNWRHPVR